MFSNNNNNRAQPRETRGLGADKQCPLDPYFILPDKCSCVDFQTLKMQELPDDLPQGEMPRHLQLYVDRQLCDKVVPGNRVVITGIYSIKKVVTKAKVNFGVMDEIQREFILSNTFLLQ